MDGKPMSSEARRQQLAELGEYRHDNERMLVYQATMDSEADSETRERAMRDLIELIMPLECENSTQREVLILRVTRGQLPEASGDVAPETGGVAAPTAKPGVDVVLAMDIACNSRNLISELLSAARIRKYEGSRNTDYQYHQETGMWHARLTAEAGKTIPVFDFVRMVLEV